MYVEQLSVNYSLLSGLELVKRASVLDKPSNSIFSNYVI